MAAPATFIRDVATWLPDDAGSHLLRREGFCQTEGPPDTGRAEDRIAAGAGPRGRTLATGVPAVGESLVMGLTSVVALPVIQSGRVAAVVAWHF